MQCLSAFKNKTNSDGHESSVVNTGKSRTDNAKSLKVTGSLRPSRLGFQHDLMRKRTM